jgi:ABC-type branched-subunit amino acid transport system ATPase component/predicted MFS family arabinose efflux permease
VIRALRRYLNDEPLAPIAALFALNALDELDTRTFELLGPEIADHFGIDVGGFGLVTVLVVLLVPLIVMPVALFADRTPRMRLAVFSAGVWAAFSLMTGLAPALAVLVVARVGSGFGRSVNTPVHGSLIGDFYSPGTRAKAFGLHALANPIGVAFASIVAGALAEIYDWRLPFFVLAVPTVVTLVLVSRVAEPPRGRFEKVETPIAPPWRETLHRLWAIRSLRYQWIGAAWTAGSVFGVGILVPFFLRDEFGVEPGLRGVIIAIGTALSAIAVVVGTAVFQRRLDVSPSVGLRMLCTVGTVAGIALVLLSIAPSLWVFVGLLWLIMVVFAFVTPGLSTITAIVSPPEMRAAAFAIAGVVTLAGLGFSLVGFAIGSSDLRWAVAVMAPVFLRGVGFFFKAATYLDNDVARLQPGHVERARRTDDRVLLETHGLTVSYSGVQVLFGVDIEVREGEILALLGTNGAGKSTTLNAISGIVEADGGNVFFDGEAITGEPPERTVQRGIVQVPGGRGIFPGLTVEENLKMGGFLLRRRRGELDERVAEAMRLFPRLAERRLQRAGSLSGGERQMLTLAQSFLLRPRLLLIDELSLGLAPAVVQDLLVAVRAMNAAGTTIVIVEQSVNLALTLAERAYFLEKGEVRFSGATADLLARRDLLRSVFLEGAAKR